jgi:hypothetical protein
VFGAAQFGLRTPVAAAGKQANIDAAAAEEGNELERRRVRQEWKTEIGAA